MTTPTLQLHSLLLTKAYFDASARPAAVGDMHWGVHASVQVEPAEAHSYAVSLTLDLTGSTGGTAVCRASTTHVAAVTVAGLDSDLEWKLLHESVPQQLVPLARAKLLSMTQEAGGPVFVLPLIGFSAPERS